MALSDDPVHNDYKREMLFYRQAQATVIESFSRLKNMGIPTKRPEDYFAQVRFTSRGGELGEPGEPDGPPLCWEMICNF